MGNALSTGITSPPAPNPDAHQEPGNPNQPLATQKAGASPQGQPQAAPIPPSHAQTVAALRHFTAIENTAAKLLKSPECGKANLRSAVIDGVTGLVSKGYMSPSDAVKELTTFPDRPYDQKKWLETHYQQAVQAQTAVLIMHQHGALGMPPEDNAPSMDDHGALMAGLHTQLKGGARG